jgi:hypothetical protein
LTNATISIKRAGVVVRDEEVVGSNPATPTVLQQVEDPDREFRSGSSIVCTACGSQP